MASSLWIKSRAVGVTDGAGLVERELEWVFCLAHRLELAVKDALHGTTFG